MNVKKLFLIIGASVCLSGVAAAKTDSDLSLVVHIPHDQSAVTLLVGRSEEASQVKRLSPCAETATLIYTTSSHPGGNRHGALNESTGGRGGRCYFDREKHLYVVVAGLLNSQYGDTFAFGPGIKARLFELPSEMLGLSLEVGGEIPFVHYAWGRRAKAVNMPLPMVFAGINIQVGKVEIGMMQSWLPKNSARLRATLIQGTFDPIPMTSRWNEPSLFKTGEETAPIGPSLFIRYSFTSFLGF